MSFGLMEYAPVHNIQACYICYSRASFERAGLDAEELPPEGEFCSVCGQWVCLDCLDWEHMRIISETTESDGEAPICVDCS